MKDSSCTRLGGHCRHWHLTDTQHALLHAQVALIEEVYARDMAAAHVPSGLILPTEVTLPTETGVREDAIRLEQLLDEEGLKLVPRDTPTREQFRAMRPSDVNAYLESIGSRLRVAPHNLFPVQRGDPIPWPVAQRAYLEYARRFGTDQSLVRLAERGGFSVGELDDLLPGWRELAYPLSS